MTVAAPTILSPYLAINTLVGRLYKEIRLQKKPETISSYMCLEVIKGWIAMERVDSNGDGDVSELCIVLDKECLNVVEERFTLVAYVKEFGSFLIIQNICANEGLKNLRFQYLGGFG
ncbi:hypothetical protein Tco_0062033 [Tanacetum coccineum]